MRNFAIGRVLSIAAAGEPGVHPSVRWGGSPGRRSHTKTTLWALGRIPTVRIGAGAWPSCQAQEKAATPVGKPHLTVLGKKHLPVEEKGKAHSRKKTLLGKRNCSGVVATRRGRESSLPRGGGEKVRWAHRCRARLRSVPPLRAASVSTKKPGGLNCPLDNPHRRCSAWLGSCVISIRS